MLQHPLHPGGRVPVPLVQSRFPGSPSTSSNLRIVQLGTLVPTVKVVSWERVVQEMVAAAKHLMLVGQEVGTAGEGS